MAFLKEFERLERTPKGMKKWEIYDQRLCSGRVIAAFLRHRDDDGYRLRTQIMDVDVPGVAEAAAVRPRGHHTIVVRTVVPECTIDRVVAIGCHQAQTAESQVIVCRTKMTGNVISPDRNRDYMAETHPV